jgi:medium-chain acyl-[acyl-carrier-protein] hydrolase
MTSSMTSSQTATPWFTSQRLNPRARVRLFCFPYAGGGSAIYRLWPQSLPSEVEVFVAHLPGRGTRLREQAFSSLDALVETAAEAIAPLLDKPFALFGHSMGAMISFELARRLREQGQPQPARLFVSGRRAPQLPHDDPISYNLPDAELGQELLRLNGTPKEVLEHPELMELMLPLLRADFSVVETYVYRPGVPPDCPLTVFGGLRDAEVSREQLEAWREQTAGEFTLRMLPGDHFFLNEPQSQLLLLGALAKELNQVPQRP